MKEKEEDVLAQIEKTLLRIVTHEDCPEIILVELDTGGSTLPEEGIIPYLNLTGSNVLEGENLDEAIQTAIEEDEFGYILDVLDNIDWDEFEIRLPALYPDWPKEIDKGNEKIVASLNATFQNHKEKFRHVKKLYFHTVDNFNFVKIIDDSHGIPDTYSKKSQ